MDQLDRQKEKRKDFESIVKRLKKKWEKTAALAEKVQDELAEIGQEITSLEWAVRML